MIRTGRDYYYKEAVLNIKAKYFCFEPSNSGINNHGDDAADALIKAFHKRSIKMKVLFRPFRWFRL